MGQLSNGSLYGNGTLYLAGIVLFFAIRIRKIYWIQKAEIERNRKIQINEDRLRKTYNIYKIRKANKRKEVTNF